MSLRLQWSQQDINELHQTETYEEALSCKDNVIAKGTGKVCTCCRIGSWTPFPIYTIK